MQGLVGAEGVKIWCDVVPGRVAKKGVRRCAVRRTMHFVFFDVQKPGCHSDLKLSLLGTLQDRDTCARAVPSQLLPNKRHCACYFVTVVCFS